MRTVKYGILILLLLVSAASVYQLFFSTPAETTESGASRSIVDRMNDSKLSHAAGDWLLRASMDPGAAARTFWKAFMIYVAICLALMFNPWGFKIGRQHMLKRRRNRGQWFGTRT